MVTHDDLVKAAEKWLHTRNIRLTLKELHAYTMHGEQPDVMGWQHEKSVLIECKTSRADFLKDKKKRFRINQEWGMGNYRIYFCPTGIIKPEDIPDGWGLVYWDGKKAKIIHGLKGERMVQWGPAPFKGCLKSEVALFICAMNKLRKKGLLKHIYESETTMF